MEFTEHHLKLTNKELVKIAYFERGKYKKEARMSAKNVLEQRGIEDSHLASLKHEIRTSNRKERKQKLKDKDEKYGIVDFVRDMILGG